MPSCVRYLLCPIFTTRHTLDFGSRFALASGMSLLQDLHYGWRQLLRTPGFLVVAVASLALGIGANTAIFSLLNACLIKTLPIRDPQQLVMLTDPSSSGVSIGSQDGERGLLSYPEFQQMAREATLFDGLLAVESSDTRLPVRVEQSREELRSKMVSGNYFADLGVQPQLGRFFDSSVDKQLGGAPFAVLNDSFWERRFGRDPAVIGKTLTIQQTSLTIIGVAPRGFAGETVGQNPDFWVPLSMELQMKPGRDWLHVLPDPTMKVMWLHVFGRLKPGITLGQANAQANGIFKRSLEVSYASLSANSKRGFMDQRLRLRPAATGASEVRERFSEALYVVFAAVGLTLLICCANLTNLLLARANSRRREITVRLALGASKARIVRQLFTESFLLSVLGAAVGLGIAKLSAPLLVRMASSPRNPIRLDVELDPRVLLFTAAVAILTTVLFGLAPALRAVRSDMSSSLREGARGMTASAARMRLSKLFVVGQVALSLLLLVGAGLFLRTLLNLQNLDLGYAREKLLLIRVDALSAGYSGERLPILFTQLLQNFRNTPGVRGATYSSNGLFSGSESGDQVLVEGYTAHGKNDRGARFDRIGPGYFSTVGIPMLMGREVGEQDRRGTLQVCVINDAFAKRFFAQRNPLGKHITQLYGDQKDVCEIIGVAKDSRDHNLRGELPPRFFLPVAQNKDPGDIGAINFEVRTIGDAAGMLNTLRRVVDQTDSKLVVNSSLLGELVDQRIGQDKMIANLTTLFGLLALGLAAIGIYGVLAYGVSQRTSEIGIRMALGAQSRNVIGMIVNETVVMVAIGLAAGLVASYFATRLIESKLFGLHGMDPSVLGAAVGVMAVIGILAAYGPAWRASRIDPARALRSE
jgi:predicted permease